MKKNNIIFLMIIIGIVCFIGYKIFLNEPYNKRSIERNNVKEFTISNKSDNKLKKDIGFYDIYNNSGESIEEFGQQIETVFPAGYKSYGDFFNGVVMNYKGNGELTYKPAEFKKYSGKSFELINGEYEVGNEIEKGEYNIQFDPKDKDEILEVILSDVENYKDGSGINILYSGEEKSIKLTNDSKVKINTYKKTKQWEKLEDGEKVKYEKRLATNSLVKFTKND